MKTKPIPMDAQSEKQISDPRKSYFLSPQEPKTKFFAHLKFLTPNKARTIIARRLFILNAERN